MMAGHLAKTRKKQIFTDLDDEEEGIADKVYEFENTTRTTPGVTSELVDVVGPHIGNANEVSVSHEFATPTAPRNIHLQHHQQNGDNSEQNQSEDEDTGSVSVCNCS